MITHGAIRPDFIRLRRIKRKVECFEMLQMYFWRQYLREFLYTIPAILIAITAHEFAHGFVSSRLGDPTPRRDGRLTLNPLAHLDPWETISLLLFRMGWANPVRINTAYYRNKKAGIIMVSLAGPCMNYLIGFLGLLIYGICFQNDSSLGTWFYYLAVVNIGLGTFNLIPLPPLDGSNVLQELFPGVKRFYFSFRRYAAPLLFLLLLTGILRVPLNWINNQILNGMWRSVVRILHIVIVPSGGGVVV